jgi:hypothetical protein
MMSEHDMALAWMVSAEGRAYMEDQFGRTPAEAMEKLKQRNPDYDHKAMYPGGPKSGPVQHETTCTCGQPIYLKYIDSAEGIVYTHRRDQV